MDSEEEELTKSARGIRTRFWPRRPENARDLSMPNTDRKSSDVIEGNRCLFGSMISSSILRNSLCTYSFTPKVVPSNWVPSNELNSINETYIEGNETKIYQIRTQSMEKKNLTIYISKLIFFYHVFLDLDPMFIKIS